MMMDDERTPGMERIEPELPPPPGLRDRVVGELSRRGLLRTRAPRSRTWIAWSGALAATLAAFLLGWAAGQSRIPTPSPGGQAGGPAVQPPGDQYLLLLYPGEMAPVDQYEEARLVGEYSRWAGQLFEEGRLVGAEKLGEGGVALQGGVVGAPPESPGDLSGYFLVRASDSAEAVALARQSPHAWYGGLLVIKRIEPI